MAEKNNTARAAGRVAARMAGKKIAKTKFLRASWEGIKATGRSLRNTLLALFHQVTGFFFLIFTLIGAAGCWREYQSLHGGAWNSKMWAAVIFTAIFTWFTVTSFWQSMHPRK